MDLVQQKVEAAQNSYKKLGTIHVAYDTKLLDLPVVVEEVEENVELRVKAENHIKTPKQDEQKRVVYTESISPRTSILYIYQDSYNMLHCLCVTEKEIEQLAKLCLLNTKVHSMTVDMSRYWKSNTD